MTMECPWVALKDVVHLFGVRYETAKNRIYAQTFPVPVRREGKLLVVDKAVLEAYFKAQREKDMAKLRLPAISPNG